MVSRLILLLRILTGKGAISRTLDAPNGAAVIFLWRRYFEEQARLEAADSDEEDSKEVSILESPEHQEFRRNERLNYHMRLKGQTVNHPLSLATVAHQQLEERVARDEVRVLRPNLQVPTDHDRAMYLAQ